MKRTILLLSTFLVINNAYSQVDYGSCQQVTSGSPCFFGLYSFWITAVNFGTLNFSGGTCDDGTDNGYQDRYSLDSGSVMPDSTYIFTVTRSGSSGGGFLSAWVDWNNDGDFADTLELLFTVSGAVGNKTRTFSVTVPSNAVVGEHRLRVRSDGSDPGGNPNPCATTGPYGDTKDFKIIVAGTAICSVKLHTPWDDVDPICLYGCSATLWAEPTGVPPFTYSWSPVTSTDSFITNACADTYIVSMTDNNGCTATDSATITQPDSISITAIVQQ